MLILNEMWTYKHKFVSAPKCHLHMCAISILSPGYEMTVKDFAKFCGNILIILSRINLLTL